MNLHEHFITGDFYIINYTESINLKHSIRMDSAENYARRVGKWDIYILTEWVNAVESLIQIGIKKNTSWVNEHQRKIDLQRPKK